MNYLRNFPIIYFYFFDGKEIDFCCCLSVVLNIWDWFFGYGLHNWTVMLIVQRTVLFVYLLIVKRARIFLSLSLAIFLLCCVFWIILPISEPCRIFNCKVELLPWTVRHGTRAFKPCHIFNCKVEPLLWTARHGSRAFKTCHIFNCKVEPLYVILNHASELFPIDF